MPQKGLVIGINYSWTHFALRYAESDAKRFIIYLYQIFPQIQLETLFGQTATKAKILESFRNLILNSKEGDLLVFYFSGHGTQVSSLRDIEDDGKDEAILASDSPNFRDIPKLILDDEFAEILEKLPTGVSFRAVVDCCNSGTLFDLEYKYLLLNLSSGIPTLVQTKHARLNKNFGDCISLSSSIDSQSSIETKEGGVLTTALLEIPVKSLCSFFVNSLYHLTNHFQIPRLCSNFNVQNQIFWEPRKN